VGQIAYSTQNGIEGSVSQGVQQPYEIQIVTSTSNANVITLECLIYPNPATDLIQLKVEPSTTGITKYELTDVSGKLLKKSIITSSVTDIKMQDYQSATYFLTVINGNDPIKVFKIIKN
jgi:hypothetical protein